MMEDFHVTGTGHGFELRHVLFLGIITFTNKVGANGTSVFCNLSA